MRENAIAFPCVAMERLVNPLPLPEKEEDVKIPVMLIPPAPVIIPEEGIDAPYEMMTGPDGLSA
jgi:hypothetical protein